MSGIRPTIRLATLASAFAATVSLTAPGALAASQVTPDTSVSVSVPEVAAAAAPTSVPDLPRSPAQISREALPAVVEVVTYGPSGAKLGGGSGFIVAPEGRVVTSHHVLEGAARVEVVLGSGEVFEAIHVSAADARWDLVVLRIAGFGLPTVRLGDAREVQVGDRLVVIGSPLGLTNTVTDGLVSSKRDMDGRRLLQISAPISKGSSGGPVFDMRGRVIGVLAGFLRTGQNVNFAVPIEYARGLLELPAQAFSVESIGRKRVDLLGGRGYRGRDLSLQAVLRGENVPGEEQTPWALQPRRVDAERVKKNPVGSPAELEGVWELRELSRVPHTKSGMYRGVLVSDGTRLHGSFFGSLVSDPGFETQFSGDRVRDIDLEMGPEGRATLEAAHGCSYFVHASPDAMVGVYECTDAEGAVYDLGAVELRRVEGEGPSGSYEIAEEAPLGTEATESRGRAVVYALEDGRWLGKLVTEEGRRLRVFSLRDGRWTRDGHLSARLGSASGARVHGTFESGAIELSYVVGGEDYAVTAHLRGARVPATASAGEEGEEGADTVEGVDAGEEGPGERDPGEAGEGGPGEAGADEGGAGEGGAGEGGAGEAGGGETAALVPAPGTDGRGR